MTKKRVSPEDLALWNKVVAGAKPLPGSPAPETDTAVGRVISPDLAPDKASGAEPPVDLPLAPLPRFTPPASRGNARGGKGSVSFELADQAPRHVGHPEPGLDRRTAQRLRKGERAPDARIDLHGMTADRAHRALDRFMDQAVAQGLRCVLVITGKGGRSAPEDAFFMRPDQGVLRQAAPRWITSGRHRSRIVGIYQAHQRHGGGGAFYVYLKRSR